MEGGNVFTVFLSSIFFVFLALLKQNVFIFVTTNLKDPHFTQNEKRIFSAFDFDKNNVLDSDEVKVLASVITSFPTPSSEESEVGVEYLDVRFETNTSNFKHHLCAGENINCLAKFNHIDMPSRNKTKTYHVTDLDIFKPKTVKIGETWTLYVGSKLDKDLRYFNYPIKKSKPHYILKDLLSSFHWNVMFDLHRGQSLSAAMITGISRTNVRVNLIITAQFQLNNPPNPAVWLSPGECFIGEIVYSRDLTSVSHVHVRNRGALIYEGDEGHTYTDMNGKLEVSSVTSSYRYEIQRTKLEVIKSPSEHSDKWVETVSEWETILRKKYSI